MFIEKKRKGVSPRLLTSNGTTNGVITLADTTDLFVKQIIYLASNSQQPRELEIKRFINETSFKVGPRGSSITTYADVSDFLLADEAVLSAPEQDRPGITEKEHERAVYAEEPIVAKRVIAVDKHGNYYTVENPMPVKLSDGSVNIGTVNAELEVQLSHRDNYPDVGDVHDSVRIGDGTDEVTTTRGGQSVGLDVVEKNTIFSKPFDKLEILSKNDDGDPLQIKTTYNLQDVQLVTIQYDSDGDILNVEVSDL